MKLLFSAMISLGLMISTAHASPKRKVAQEKVQCVPLGVSFSPFVGEEIPYTADELKMLRNSIYAQLGFSFKSKEVTDEMAKRGCLKSDVKFMPESLTKVDKKNISQLKALEKSIRESDEGFFDFKSEYAKTANDAAKRAHILESNYCYLFTANYGDFLGLLHFSNEKAGDQYILEGMMNIRKPTFTKGTSKEAQDQYINDISDRTIDTTSVGAGDLDFAVKGSWSVMNAKPNMGDIKISIKAMHQDFKNATIDIASDEYKKTGMLHCILRK